MSRSVVTDLLQIHPFWLMEAAPIDPLALPMLTPLFGFSSMTAPEIVADVRDITEGNWYFKKKVIKGAEVSSMTMERGVTWYDSDFWRWMLAGISGDLSNSKLGINAVSLKVGGITPRRTLMLVQFITRLPFQMPTGGILGAAASTAVQTGLKASATALAGGSPLDVGVSAVQGLAFGALGALGPFEFTARLPAKAWLLHGCLPVRYKVGSDFDASSSALSVQQCEIAVEMMEEVSLVA